MEIEEKYLNLLNLLIYDKRRQMNGMLSELCISVSFGGHMIYYKAHMSKTHANDIIFVEDFEKRNVVFLQPFSVNYQKELLEEMAERQENAIKEFFGDKFHEDMIMKISEEERQEQIRQWDSLMLGLENWDKVMEHKGWNDAAKELPGINKEVLCVVDGEEGSYQKVCFLYDSAHWTGIEKEKDVVKWWRHLPDEP